LGGCIHFQIQAPESGRLLTRLAVQKAPRVFVALKTVKKHRFIVVLFRRVELIIEIGLVPKELQGFGNRLGPRRSGDKQYHIQGGERPGLTLDLNSKLVRLPAITAPKRISRGCFFQKVTPLTTRVSATGNIRVFDFIEAQFKLRLIVFSQRRIIAECMRA